MIKLQNLTPSVYYTKSRDFQFIGRLYDIVLNSVKTNADNLYNLPIGDNMDEKLLNLLAFTLGFQSRHHYNSIQLRALCSVLPLVLKNKGSLNAVIIAVNSLLYAEGIQQALDYSIDPGKSITLYLPQQLTDLNLLKDLLVYILPAGIGCRMIKEIQEVKKIETIIDTESVVRVHVFDYKTGMNDKGILITDPRDAIQVVQAADFNAQNEQVRKTFIETFNNPQDKTGVLQNALLSEVNKNGE